MRPPTPGLRKRDIDGATNRDVSQPIKPTSLPERLRVTIGWQPGMPKEWRNWLRDFSYWNGELENDLE